MEYVCKVGTPAGEVVEQSFTAPDESALRSDLEQKGYYLFSIRRGFGLRELGLRRPRIPADRLLRTAGTLRSRAESGIKGSRAR